MPQLVQIVRDVITITTNLPFVTGLQPDDTLRLIARQITLTEDYDLKGRNLEIYAVTFTAANGATFLNQGANGAPGGNGGNGAMGVQPPGKRDGSDGKPGEKGSDGTAGGSVKIVAEVMTGVRVNVRGGDGGKGGAGGAGGKGSAERVRMDRRSPVLITLPNGGNGGKGGQGGMGGRGGTVTLSSVNYTTDPVVDVSGGRVGVRGVGGVFGGPGVIEWVKPPGPTPVIKPEVEVIDGGRSGTPGPAGDDNVDGSPGVQERRTVSYDAFWSALASQPFASEWAKYRHVVGEFFFRSYVPGVPDRDMYIGMAVDEFKAALRLDPARSDSALRIEQIWNNMNPLGLPRNFDVIPNFKEYIANLTNLGNLVATFTSIGNTMVLQTSNLRAFQAIFQTQKAESSIRINEANADIEISKQNANDIGTALGELQKMINTVNEQIKKAKEEMEKKPLSFRDVVGNVWHLAEAISAVMAAVPTGGASLLVIVPDVISFSKTVYNNAAPLAKAILDNEENQTLAVAKDQFNKVKKDVDDIGNASKKLTNLLDVIDKIKGGKTPDNSKLMDLLEKGAQLAYEYLLKQQELKRVQMTITALSAKVDSERELQVFYDASLARNELSEKVIREAGLKVLQAAFSRVDVLLDFAFRAQRSIEIYLLKDQTQSVFYDVGRVHPDLEADYIRDPDIIDFLVSSYQTSFARLLNPTDMWKTYQTYFNRPLLKDIRRLSFTDPDVLDAFRSTFTLTFSFDAATALSQQRYRTKIQAVGVAFVGATGEGNVVSCKLEHGGVYAERMSNGAMQQTTLQARYEIISAAITPLQTSGFDLDSSPPLDEPQSSPLWAMGVGGLYTITIPGSEFEEHHPTFDGLKEIQVWLGYQFIE